MPDAREIYRLQPERYDELVRWEDRDGTVLSCLRALRPLEGAKVIEFGAGTGRLTRLLAPYVHSIKAFELEPTMVEVARHTLAQLGIKNCELNVADNIRVPVPDTSADLALAGWTYGHQTVWNEAAWRPQIEQALEEMLRVLLPGGIAVVLETLGTGHTNPFDPPPGLADYFALLEERYHFKRTWLRTDYEFPSKQRGEELLRFFFGDDTARKFLAVDGTRFPECTGVWWRRKGIPDQEKASIP